MLLHSMHVINSLGDFDRMSCDQELIHGGTGSIQSEGGMNYFIGMRLLKHLTNASLLSNFRHLKSLSTHSLTHTLVSISHNKHKLVSLHVLISLLQIQNKKAIFRFRFFMLRNQFGSFCALTWWMVFVFFVFVFVLFLMTYTFSTKKKWKRKTNRLTDQQHTHTHAHSFESMLRFLFRND